MTALGVALLMLGALVPSALWIESVRSVPDELRASLLRGATLFRVGLAGLGLYALLVPRLALSPGVDAPRRAARRLPRAEALALALLLAVALGARLHRLGDDLWLDEILMRIGYVRLPLGEILSTFPDQNQHIGYSLLARLSVLAFGDSAAALRLPAALYGVGGVAALYALARELGPRREALGAAALLALSYHHVWFSQNARGYTGVLFWTLVSSALLLRGLADPRPRPRLWLAFAVAVAAGLYTHLTMAFVALTQLLLYALELARRRGSWRGRWLPLVHGFALAGLLAFTLYAPVLPQFFQSAVHDGTAVEAWKSPLWTLAESLRAFGLTGPRGVLVLVALAFFGLGVASFLRERPALVGLLVAPAALITATAVAISHHLWPRSYFLLAGFGVLIELRGLRLAAEGAATRLGRPPGSAPRAGAAAVGAALALSAATLPGVYGPKQQLEGARAFVEARRAAGDAVVALGVARIAYGESAPSWESAEDAAELRAITRRARRTWTVHTFPLHMRSVHADIVEMLERDFHLAGRFDGSLNDGAVLVHVREPAAGDPEG